MRYYTLVIREDGKWAPQFGDYKKSVVVQEITDSYHHIPKGNRLIIETEEDQASIDIAVFDMNHSHAHG